MRRPPDEASVTTEKPDWFLGINWPEFWHEARSATIWIILGLGVITSIQAVTIGLWWILPPIRPFMNYWQVSASDWNTVRAIWFAEVPLAYLLRRVLGTARQEMLEREGIYAQNLSMAFQLNGIEEIGHLEYHSVEATKDHPKGLGYIINTSTHKRYRTDIYLEYGVDGLRIPKFMHPSQAELDRYCKTAQPAIERCDTVASIRDLKPLPKPSGSS